MAKREAKNKVNSGKGTKPESKIKRKQVYETIMVQILREILNRNVTYPNLTGM